MSGYVEYLDLSDVDREAVHAWVDNHGINHKDVPLDGIRFDTETDEYVITVYDRTASGNWYVDEHGEPVTFEVRRPAQPLLPWPKRESAA